MTMQVTMIGGGIHMLLAGGYALWTQASRQQLQALAVLTIVQSSQYSVKNCCKNDQNQFYVQLFYDVLPFLFFIALKTDRVKTAIMGILYAGLGRASVCLDEYLSEERGEKLINNNEEQRKDAQKFFVDFYLGKCPNLNNVTIEDILKYDHQKLEAYHNFIQWLFPLKKPSPYEPKAPILNQAIIQAFKADPELKLRLKKSFRLMLWHYGLEVSENDVVQRAGNFNKRKHQMLGHNLLRITRILSSLVFLGEEGLAKSFYQCLKVLYDEKSMGNSFSDSFEKYWSSIAQLQG